MQIRLMTQNDVEFAFHCTQAEGWAGSSKEIFYDFLEHDRNGCFIACEDKRAVGICVATHYKRTGFIGELIVINDMRGRGIGSALFQSARQYLYCLGINTIYLDGELQAVPIYEKYQFKKKCLSMRFTGKLAGKKYGDVRPVVLEDLPVIYELDRIAFGDDRSFFLKKLHTLYPRYCLVLEKNNTICGYIMARPGQNLITVGPWVITDNSAEADILFQTLAAQTGDQQWRIGVLESNQPAVELLRANQAFQEQTPCWRMVSGPDDIVGKPEQLFANGSGAKG